MNKLKLCINNNKFLNIKDERLSGIYTNVKNKIIDIIVYIDKINLGNISKSFVINELNNIITSLNKIYEEYTMLIERLDGDDLSRNVDRLIENISTIKKQLDVINFKNNDDLIINTTHLKSL